MAEPIHVDCILYPRWIGTMAAHPSVIDPVGKSWLEDHACVVHQGEILALLPNDQVKSQYQAQFEYNLSDHLLMPGLINSHCHNAMTLLRGIADDYPLMTWLEEHIWPAEAAHVCPEFVQVGTELAISEMLASGITTFNDMYFFPETVASLLESTGLRGFVSSPIIEFPTPWAKDAAEGIKKSLELVQQYKGHPRIAAGFGPHAPYTVANKTWEILFQLAQDHSTWIHTHLHETAFEVEQSIQEHRKRPIERLVELGLTSVSSQLVHMTQIEDSDLDLLRDKPAHIVHCPESNLKLASGFTPVDKILKAGINVAIGTDGASSNNDLDMVSEMKTAAILAKAVASDAQALPAYAAAYASTRAGALAFNQNNLGAISPGFRADIIAVNLSALNTQPVYDPIAQFVYASNSRQISHVWVEGKLVCEHGQNRVIDTESLHERIKFWQHKIRP